MKLPERIKTALEKLGSNGFEAFVVGGSVRDLIMGKEPADYDITTNALPEQTAEVFKEYKVIKTGIKHGTVTVVIGGENIEITTYRIDCDYLDNRRPENVVFTSSVEDDLSRRDFTMNAIAYCPEKGIIDPLGGKKDIENMVIRCVGNPDRRFNEDGLRILRALRFSSQTGFEIEKNTSAAIFRNKQLIKNISVERIFVEFKKLILGKWAFKVIDKYKEVLGVFLPEILPMIGFEQKTKYHEFDVFTHTMKALDNSAVDEIVRLAVFFHDIGKPDSLTVDSEGVYHFKGHAEESARYTDNILKRLKTDNVTRKTVCELISMHSEKIMSDEFHIKKLLSNKGEEFVRLLLEVKKADASAKAKDYTNPPELLLSEKIIDNIVKSGDPLYLSDLSVKGNDIVALGIKGKKVGVVLEYLLDLVLSDKVKNDREKLLKCALEFIKNE